MSSTDSTTSSGTIVTIVVGADGSDSSEQALRWAARQSRLTGDQLHAVISRTIPTAYGYAPVIDVQPATVHQPARTLHRPTRPGVPGHRLLRSASADHRGYVSD